MTAPPEAPRPPVVIDGRPTIRGNMLAKKKKLRVKNCSKCKRLLKVSEFSARPERRSGYSSWCHSCRREGHQKRDATRAGREVHLRHAYGMTLQHWDALIIQQLGRCAVCSVQLTGTEIGSPISACVDHDHATDFIRGVLCRQCNCAIGFAADSAERLRAMAAYIEASEEAQHRLLNSAYVQRLLESGSL